MSALEQYQEIIGDSANAVISVDAGLRICLFNAAAQALFGYTAVEIIGQPLDMLLPAAARAKHSAHIADFSQSGAHAKFMADRRPLYGLDKTGRELPLEISIIEHRKPGPARFSAIIRDLSERKAYEQRLTASERKFRGLFETASSVLMMADANGHIIDINPAGCAFFHRERSAMLSLSLLAVALWGDDETAEAVAHVLHTAIRRGKDSALLQVPVAMPMQGLPRRLDFTVHRLTGCGEKDEAALFVEGRDITPLFEAHAMLAQRDGARRMPPRH